jgi:hypothetical protein
LASMVLLDVFDWWFARTGSVLGIWCKNCDVLALVLCCKCVCFLPRYPSPGRWLALLAAVVLPAPTLHAVTKLLELLVTRLDLIPLFGRVVNCYVCTWLVPNDLSDQILHLAILTQWCNGK